MCPGMVFPFFPAWPALQGMAGLFVGAVSDTLIFVLIDSQNA